MKALITGATGFIGSHLAEKLNKTGYDVSCLVRDSSDLKWLEGMDVTLCEGDCCDRDSLRDVIKGFDYVFHIAGLTKASSLRDFDTVNFRGTENVISIASENNPGLKRFVFLSSLSAFGPALYGNMPDPTMEPHPVSGYGKSKLKGEEAVLSYQDSLPVTILRPSAVYGPRDREFFLIIKMIKRGILPYWGNGNISLVYVDDLIDCMILVSQKDEAVGRTYFVSDGMVYTNDSIINDIAFALSARVFKLKLPKPILPAIGFFGERISKIMGNTSMVNRDKMKELKYSNWVCGNAEAREELGFKPEISFQQGIKWTIDWYRTHKWL
jgi:nucleoside-diphosphate-sugar epimerase